MVSCGKRAKESGNNRHFDDFENEFGMRFTGKLEVKTDGEYAFRLASDDGSRLSVERLLDQAILSGAAQEVGRCGSPSRFRGAKLLGDLV